MGYIRNSSDETLDLILISAEPQGIKSESISNMLNGDWHIQTIGTRAEKLIINLIVAYSVLKSILNYADTKELLTVNFLDFTKTGCIIGQPSYEILRPGIDPLYTVDFELAVIPNV